MYKLYCPHVLMGIVSLLLAGCWQQSTSDNNIQPTEEVIQALPDSALSSIDNLEFVVELVDSVHPGTLQSLADALRSDSCSITFRGNLYRDADYNGRVKGRPTRIVRDWLFETDEDFTPTKLGIWGGGMGWTGQPLIVTWPDSVLAQFKQQSPALTPDFGRREVIAGSLYGAVYFINYDTGKASRQLLPVGNPVKGTPTLDPSLNGNLYVGQGVPRDEPFGQTAFNLFSHKQILPPSRDPDAWRGWGGNDSSPVVVGGFLIWPSENSTIYKYRIADDGTLGLHSLLRYRVKGGKGAGVESSMCVYRNYGYVGDNQGNIVCIDLNTLHPIWHTTIHDDIDATPVLEVENNRPVVFAACEVDRQGDKGMSHLVKLDGLTGATIWQHDIVCNRQVIGEKHFDGGIYGTPLLGRGNCKDRLFVNICQIDDSRKAFFCAFDRQTGEEIYRTPLKHFAWNSPVAFYNERDEMFVFTGDSAGNAYLIDAATGQILFTQVMANNFESSASVLGNSLVIGSRGKQIYRFSIV